MSGCFFLKHGVLFYQCIADRIPPST